MRATTASELLLASTLAIGAIAGCSTGTDNTTFEPDVGRMVITVITSSGTAGTDYSATDAANGFSGATASVGVGLFTVQSSFYKPDGARISGLPPADFELRVSTSAVTQTLPPGISFERTGPLSGTITGMEEGQELSFYFSLYHVTMGHNEIGPYALKIQRTVSDGGGGGGGGPPPP